MSTVPEKTSYGDTPYRDSIYGDPTADWDKTNWKKIGNFALLAFAISMISGSAFFGIGGLLHHLPNGLAGVNILGTNGFALIISLGFPIGLVCGTLSIPFIRKKIDLGEKTTIDYASIIKLAGDSCPFFIQKDGFSILVKRIPSAYTIETYPTNRPTKKIRQKTVRIES